MKVDAVWVLGGRYLTLLMVEAERPNAEHVVANYEKPKKKSKESLKQLM